MKNSLFKEILSKISTLTHDQRIILKDAIEHSSDIDHMCDLLQKKIEEDPECPHCHGKSLVRNGFKSGLTRYRCKCCKKRFNALTKTPFAHLRNKERWLKYLECMTESKTVRKSASACAIHRNTAFRWRHKLLNKSHNSQPQILKGVVEADKTYFRKSQKGSNKIT